MKNSKLNNLKIQSDTIKDIILNNGNGYTDKIYK